MDKKDLFEKVKPLVEHNNLTVEQKAKLYDDWSATYDEVRYITIRSFKNVI